MKPLLIKVFLFFAILLIVAYAADYIVTSGLKKTGDRQGGGNDEFTVWNAIISSSIDADLVINGTSRAHKHINPFVLDSVLGVQSYNIGMSGAEFNKQYIRYMTFEKYCKKPKVIIQEVDYSTLSISNERDDRFFPYLFDIDKNLIREQLKWVNNFYFYVPAVRYSGLNSYIMQGFGEFFHLIHFPDVKVKGFYANDLPWDGSELSKILLGDSLVSQKQTEAIKLFDSFLSYCKENDIQVVMVFTPEYIKATEFVKDKSDVINIYNSFSKKYDIPFFNYSTDSLCYDTTYFYNAEHLNRKGAKLFSLRFANDIKNLGIIKDK